MINPADFGTVAIAVAYIAIAGSLFNFQGDKYLITSDEVKKDFSSVFIAELLLALFAIFALLMFIYFNRLENSNILLITFVLIVLSPVFLRGRVLFEREMQFTHVRLAQLCISICSLLSTIFLFKYDFISELIAIVLFRYLALALEGLYFLLSATSVFCIKSFSIHKIKRLFRVNSGLWISGLVVVLYSNIDYIIIDNLDVTKTDAGYYWLSFTFLILMTRFRNALNEVLLPHFRKASNSDQPWYINAVMTFSLGTYLIPFLLVFLIGESFFISILGEEWSGAFKIVLIFLIVGFLKGCVGIFDVYLLAMRMNHHFVPIALIYLLVLSLLGFAATSLFGIIGMASSVFLATLISACYTSNLCLKNKMRSKRYTMTFVILSLYMIILSFQPGLDFFWRLLISTPILASFLYYYRYRSSKSRCIYRDG